MGEKRQSARRRARAKEEHSRKQERRRHNRPFTADSDGSEAPATAAATTATSGNGKQRAMATTHRGAAGAQRRQHRRVRVARRCQEFQLVTRAPYSSSRRRRRLLHARSAAFARQLHPQRGHRAGATERYRTRPRYVRKRCVCGADAPSMHLTFPVGLGCQIRGVARARHCALGGKR